MSREHFKCSASKNTSSCTNLLESNFKKKWSVDDKDKKHWIEVRFQRLLSISEIQIDGNVKILEIKNASNKMKVVPRISLRSMERSITEFSPAIIVSSLNITISMNKNESSTISITEIRFYGSTGKNIFEITNRT